MIKELKAGEIITNSYSNISNKGYIDVCGGTYTTGGKPKSQGYAANWYGDEEVWTAEDAKAAYAKQHGLSEDQVESVVTTNSNGHTSITVKVKDDVSFSTSTQSTGGSIILGSYDLTEYKTLKFTVKEYSGGGYFILNQNAIKSKYPWEKWNSSSGTDIGEKISINEKKEYLIDIKNYTGIYNLKFVSNSTSGFKIINVYLEG